MNPLYYVLHRTLTVNRVTDYTKEKLLELESSHGLTFDDFQSSEGVTEDTENLRTFPVPLSDNVTCDSQKSLEVRDEGYKEQSVGTLVVSESDKFVSGYAVRDSGEELTASAHGEEQVKGICQGLEKLPEGDVEPQASHAKEITSSKSVENSRKVDTSEVKRKNAKRTFKSENEFLKFTLKYQQVLAKRDYAVAVRDKLESLCRELQRQNKILMDERKRVSTEGQSLRLDLSTMFQDAIKDVGIKLEEQNDDCLTQLKDNEMLGMKLMQLDDQYTLTEQQFTQKLKKKMLELQVADLKMQQDEKRSAQEQCQMKLYAEQDALLKSSEAFETFKQEIEKMEKLIKELKKECTFTKSKCEKSDIALIELFEEREHLKHSWRKPGIGKKSLSHYVVHFSKAKENFNWEKQL